MTSFKGQHVYKGHFAQSKISLSGIHEPVLKGHLSIKGTLLQSLWCPLNTGFTVICWVYWTPHIIYLLLQQDVIKHNSNAVNTLLLHFMMTKCNSLNDFG